jgi:hypothetical protein
MHSGRSKATNNDTIRVGAEMRQCSSQPSYLQSSASSKPATGKDFKPPRIGNLAEKSQQADLLKRILDDRRWRLPFLLFIEGFRMNGAAFQLAR